MKKPLLKLTSFLLTGLFLMGMCSTGMSQEAPVSADRIGKDSSLTELVAHGLMANPGLKSQFHRWKGALERVGISGSMPDPTLSFAYFINEVETRVGPQQGKLGVMQRFPWFGKLKLKKESALQNAAAEEQILYALKSKLKYKIKEQFYRYSFLDKKIEILAENLKLLDFFLKVIEAKYQSSSVPLTHLIKVQIEHEKLSDYLEETRDLLRASGGTLNALLNRPLTAPLPRGQQLPLSPLKIPLPDLISRALEKNPALRSLDIRINQGQTGVSLARKKFYPDMGLGIDYIFTGDFPMDPMLSEGNDPIVLKGQFNIPLSFKKLKSGVSEAEFQKLQITGQKEEAVNDLTAGIHTAFSKYQVAAKRSLLYRDSIIPKGKQAIEITLTAYQADKADILEFIDSQRTVLDLELSFQKSLADQARYLAELEHLVGESFTKEM